MFALPLETERGEKIRHSVGMDKEDGLNDASRMSDSEVCISCYWRT